MTGSASLKADVALTPFNCLGNLKVGVIKTERQNEVKLFSTWVDVYCTSNIYSIVQK